MARSDVVAAATLTVFPISWACGTVGEPPTPACGSSGPSSYRNWMGSVEVRVCVVGGLVLKGVGWEGGGKEERGWNSYCGLLMCWCSSKHELTWWLGQGSAPSINLWLFCKSFQLLKAEPNQCKNMNKLNWYNLRQINAKINYSADPKLSLFSLLQVFGCDVGWSQKWSWGVIPVLQSTAAASQGRTLCKIAFFPG